MYEIEWSAVKGKLWVFYLFSGLSFFYLVHLSFKIVFKNLLLGDVSVCQNPCHRVKSNGSTIIQNHRKSLKINENQQKREIASRGVEERASGRKKKVCLRFKKLLLEIKTNVSGREKNVSGSQRYVCAYKTISKHSLIGRKAQ